MKIKIGDRFKPLCGRYKGHTKNYIVKDNNYRNEGKILLHAEEYTEENIPPHCVRVITISKLNNLYTKIETQEGTK